MNIAKARDFYSSYYEGTLDEGLSQAFERALASDAQISAEYRQFVRIMQELRAVAVPVSTPPDLHAKIRERLDASILTAERASRRSAWFFAWKPIAYGAVATAALIGVVASFSNRAPSGLSTANLGVSHGEAPRIVVTDGTVRLQFATVEKNVVTVTDVGTGERLMAKWLERQRLDSPIKNLSDRPILVAVGFAEGFAPIYVAVPGGSLAVSEEGSGTLQGLMEAIAGMYGCPVVAQATDFEVRVDWTLDSTDVLAAVSDELKALGLKAELRESGLLWIGSN